MIPARRLLAAALALGLAALPASAPAVPRAAPPASADPVVSGRWRSPAATPGAPHPGRSGQLTSAERALAEMAWRYLRNNTQPATGLVNAVENYPSTTLWDMGSAIAGVTAAQGLGLIDRGDASARLGAMLDTLGRLTLFRGLCPNKAYDTRNGERVDYANQPGEIGCSALDVARLLVWLRITAQRYPELAKTVDTAAAHLNVGSMVAGGVLQGAAIDPAGKTVMLQEGRLGYEEYGAKAFRMWGFDTREAEKPQPYGIVTLYGVQVPYDARDPKALGAHNYVVAESAVLDGIEFGWNEPDDAATNPFEHRTGWFASVADSIYRVQEARHARTGILTARTEHQLKGAPYFVYDTVFSDGQPWATITDAGVSVPQASALSAKAAIGMWALWQTAYTDKLFAAARALAQPDHGIQEGQLEAGGPIDAYTVNTNAIILESLLYKVEGRLLRAEPSRSPPPTPAPLEAALTPAPAAPQPLANLRRELSEVIPTTGRRGALTPDEMEAARIAWRYFENNTQPATGMINAVDNYQSTTLWDTAAGIGAIVSAHELGVIASPEAQARLTRIVAALGNIRLFRDRCPNKAYDTVSLVPTDYGNQPAEIGCSAIDAGRILVWMRIVHDRYPALRKAVDAAVAHWKIGTLVRGGELWGTAVVGKTVVFRQEGRLGYEEYAAKGFQLWGQRTATASRPEPFEVGNVEGVPIAHDKRDGLTTGGHNYVVTESNALDGIEFDWTAPGATAPDAWTVAQARNVYLAQQRRYQRTGILTARTEHQLARAPHFVYDSIFTNGQPWATIDVSGDPVHGAEAVATKAAIGMWALWPTAYSDMLFAKVLPGRDPARGFFEGQLESGGIIRAFTANTNGIILETLLYKAKGPLIRLPAL